MPLTLNNRRLLELLQSWYRFPNLGSDAHSAEDYITFERGKK
jgi:hypothetical protein